MTSKELTTKAIEWLTGQSFNNLLLLMILASFAWFAHHSITVAVPSHLRQIQEGYETIIEDSRENERIIREQHDAWLDRIIGEHGNVRRGNAVADGAE